ncbi:MAG: hypothetical protein ACUVS9_05240, partial [Thermaceae bacterium]
LLFLPGRALRPSPLEPLLPLVSLLVLLPGFEGGVLNPFTAEALLLERLSAGPGWVYKLEPPG